MSLNREALKGLFRDPPPPPTEKEIEHMEFLCRIELAKQIYGDRITHTTDHIWVKSLQGAGHHTFDPLQNAEQHEEVLFYIQKNTKYSAGKQANMLNTTLQLKHQNDLIRIEVERNIKQDGYGPAGMFDVWNYGSVKDMREGHLKLAITLILFLCSNDMIENSEIISEIKSIAMRIER